MLAVAVVAASADESMFVRQNWNFKLADVYSKAVTVDSLAERSSSDRPST